MRIKQLNISHIRNIEQAELELHPQLNWVYGDNGSGKTSLLEAINLLATGKSFRNHQFQRIVSYKKNESTVFIATHCGARVGMKKTRSGEVEVSLNGDKERSISPIVQLLPIVTIHPESYQIVTGGPRERRNLLNWGVFHVEQCFLELWRRYAQIIKHRNAALKQGHTDKLVKIWDKQLTEIAARIDEQRQNYIAQYFPQLVCLLSAFLTEEFCLDYSRGWRAESNLADIFEQTLPQDRSLGYTSHGPHTADLKFKLKNSGYAKDYLSRGQLKLLTLALKLAQGMVLQQLTSKSSIYMLDDLASELDEGKQEILHDVLSKINAQIFITSIHKRTEKFNQAAKVFHVKHGTIKEQC